MTALLLLLAPLALADPPASPATPTQAGAPAVRLPCRDCTLPEAVQRAGHPWPPRDLRLVLDKSDHELTAWVGGQPVKTWRVGLGDPAGDKVRQGDQKTPVGTFRVVTRNPQSRFHKFLGLSYPDAADADRGEAAGLVTAAQARAIREADRARRVPPWNTPLGGAIGLHGGGGQSDWTLGCVAVSNADIDDLWEAAPMGTVVEIRE